jgi:hypothetical protein
LLNQFKAIWGAVAWPGRRPGFAVVVGMGCARHFDSYDGYLLDEFESSDIRQLVRQCGVLDLKYGIGMRRSYDGDPFGRWVGDYRNDAASRFIQEMNEEYERTRDIKMPSRNFTLNSTRILEMENPYHYVLPQIKELLDSERRQLFLKDSRVLDYMGEIRPDEIDGLTFGDFPAIEALAFAVIAMRDHVRMKEQAALMPDWDPYPRSVLDYGTRNPDVWG